VTGLYDNHVCYKVGTNGSSSAVTYMTGNSCDVHGGDEANGIHQSGGNNMTPIVSRDNTYNVDGYVYYIADKRGQDYDEDCMWTTNDNFSKWNNVYYETFAAFQNGTGQERNGRFSQDCVSPWTPSPTPTGTPGTPSPTPAYTSTPSPTTPSYPAGTSTPTLIPGEPPLMVAALSFGWNVQCYIGASRPI